MLALASSPQHGWLGCCVSPPGLTQSGPLLTALLIPGLASLQRGGIRVLQASSLELIQPYEVSTTHMSTRPPSAHPPPSQQACGPGGAGVRGSLATRERGTPAKAVTNGVCQRPGWRGVSATWGQQVWSICSWISIWQASQCCNTRPVTPFS